MEYLQYLIQGLDRELASESFKPCYKWNTFNTKLKHFSALSSAISFKPCYKWNTFNTASEIARVYLAVKEVLNLVINGIPSIQRV